MICLATISTFLVTYRRRSIFITSINSAIYVSYFSRSATGNFESNELLSKKTCVDNMREMEHFENQKVKIKNDTATKAVGIGMLHALGLKHSFLEKSKLI